ncbi:MAG: hypothetical protein H6Q68_358 [Firmicutes bacterium]|nr:hypothetical protein [Bacillota bacterium]
MSIDDNLTYELFIKSAFNKGRCSDLAALVATDVFEPGSLEETKVAVAHAMTIFNNRIFGGSKKVDESDKTAMENFITNVINALDKKAVYTLINQYEEIRNKY